MSVYQQKVKNLCAIDLFVITKTTLDEMSLLF